MTLIGKLIKEARTGVKTTSKARPFISAADKAAMALTRPKGTGKEFMTELKKTKGVKPAEIEHRKLDQIEALPKMTKEDFLAELEKRPPAQVSERVLPEGTAAEKSDLAEAYYNKDYYDLKLDQREYIDSQLARYGMDAHGQDYHLPGGQNYREILLQLPGFGANKVDDLMAAEAMARRNPGNPMLASDVERLKAEKASYGDPYIHQHFGADNPNILAHMRVQDRTGPNGEKVLHVEEVQSDWHQEGRKKGYIDPSKKPYTIEQDQNGVYRVRDQSGQRFDPYVDGQQMSGFMTAEAAENAMKGNMGRMPKPTGVPDAPFKKNWHELAMKRLINYAAENGYDSIAITPGKEQINRYEEALRKNLDRLDYEPYKQEDTGKTLYELSGHKGGNQVFSKEDVTPEELRELVGKDMFSKIEAGHGQSLAEERPLRPNWKRLEGSDISIGGEGMKGFYDKMLPDYLNSFGKPYGAQVELGGHKLPGNPSLRGEASERLGLAGERFDQMTPEQIEAFNAKLDEANATYLHHFPITPEMRESINKERLPLYQQVGIPLGAGSAGSQVEMPFAQQPQQPEQPEEPAYAMGGAVYDTTPDMSDGGQMIQGNAFKRGGKVHFTDNLDTMFMELHDKMFKRK